MSKSIGVPRSASGEAFEGERFGDSLAEWDWWFSSIKDGKAPSEVLATGVRTPNVFGITPSEALMDGALGPDTSVGAVDSG